MMATGAEEMQSGGRKRVGRGSRLFFPTRRLQGIADARACHRQHLKGPTHHIPTKLLDAGRASCIEEGTSAAGHSASETSTGCTRPKFLY